MIALISQKNLAARLRVSNLTLKRRLAASGIAPDAALIERSRFHRASALFDLSRMGEIRAAVLIKRPHQTIAKIVPTIA